MTAQQTDAILGVQKQSKGVPRVSVTAGPSKGRALALSRSTMTVGRHPTNDLTLEDSRVSGMHLELHPTPHGIIVRDVESKNGTYLDTHRIKEVEVVLPCEIVLGDTTLRFEIDESALQAPASEATTYGTLVATSRVMREIFVTLERVATKPLSVLIQGDTGTGKEEVARAIHEHSGRKGPFVVIDATALPETLAESMLFGHEKGVFTGAAERRVGLFEAASGGTILIDEIGELPPALQAKFLRVLERHEVQRIGQSEPTPVDVRVITATHRDLRNEIDEGRFREDLYFRLAQVRIFLPSLRDRPEDIPLLAAHFVAEAKRKLSDEALAHLMQQPWPGNVRELRNVVMRAAALAAHGTIQRADLAGEGGGFRGTRDERTALDLSGTFSEAKGRAVERFESAYLSALLRRCEGNISRASREADVARHHLRDLLRKRGLYGMDE